ncbi:MAG: hypothetical protein ACRDRT_14505, partial [Pseudonocardiaceae bacterium]
MQEHSEALVEGIRATIGSWVRRSVGEAMTRAGLDLAASAAATDEAAIAAELEVADRVEALLALDVGAQPLTPLAILREAVDYPARVLVAAGVPPVSREAMRSRLFPDDIYDLAPSTFADVDETLGPLGLAWGAAKTVTMVSRRRFPVVAYVPDLIDRSKV